MNRKNQILATSLSLLLSVGMSGGTILPAYAMENAENTEVQTDVATNGNAEQSEKGVQSQKEATPEAKEKTSNQAAAQSSSLPDSSKSVKANSADEEEGEGDTASKGVAVDAKHFPDEGFRKYVSAVFDEDKNDYLSNEEIESATIIELDYMNDGGMGDSDNVVNDLLDQINDVRGIEYLSNLQYLTINMDRTCQKMSDIDLSHNTELTTLTIGPNNNDDYEGVAANTTLKKINIKKCKNLETLDIMKCSAIDSLEFPENESLRSLSIKDCDNIKNIDF